MFSQLTNFAFQRKGWQVFGFYLAWLFLIIISSALIGGLLALLMGEGFSNNFSLGLRLGAGIAILASLTLSFLISKKKGLLGTFKNIVLIIVSGLLAALGGGLLGLIIPAFLSSKPAVSKTEVAPIAPV